MSGWLHWGLSVCKTVDRDTFASPPLSLLFGLAVAAAASASSAAAAQHAGPHAKCKHPESLGAPLSSCRFESLAATP